MRRDDHPWVQLGHFLDVGIWQVVKGWELLVHDLLLVDDDVGGVTGDLLVLDRVDDGPGVDNLTPRRVDEDRRVLHLLEGVRIDHVVVLAREVWHVDRNDVTLGEQLVHPHEVDVLLGRLVWVGVKGKDVGAHAMVELGLGQSDLAGADDPNRRAVDLATEQGRLDGEVTLPAIVDGQVDVPKHLHPQRHGQLGHGVW